MHKITALPGLSLKPKINKQRQHRVKTQRYIIHLKTLFLSSVVISRNSPRRQHLPSPQRKGVQALAMHPSLDKSAGAYQNFSVLRICHWAAQAAFSAPIPVRQADKQKAIAEQPGRLCGAARLLGKPSAMPVGSISRRGINLAQPI